MATLAFRALRQVLQTPVVTTTSSKGGHPMISQSSSLVLNTACAASKNLGGLAPVGGSLEGGRLAGSMLCIVSDSQNQRVSVLIIYLRCRGSVRSRGASCECGGC